jgi:hypothetical protein
MPLQQQQSTIYTPNKVRSSADSRCVLLNRPALLSPLLIDDHAVDTHALCIASGRSDSCIVVAALVRQPYIMHETKDVLWAPTCIDST